MEQERKYRAFFSYARTDERLANWLWGLLDRYHTPSSLVGKEGDFGPIPARLHPIFRDREDLAGGGALPDRLRHALEESDSLIVLCTQASAESVWVNQEVLTFLELGRQDRIFPVIANSRVSSLHDLPAEKYMPPALRQCGLLAADLREGVNRLTSAPIGDGRRSGVHKLIAGLLGAPLDEFVRRDARRRDMRVLTLGGLAAVALTLAAGTVTVLADAARTTGDAQLTASLREVQLVEQRAAFLVERGDMREAARNAILARRLSGGRHNVDFADSVLRRIAQALPAHSRVSLPTQASYSVMYSEDGRIAAHGDRSSSGIYVVNHDTGEVMSLPNHNLLGLSADGTRLAARLLNQIHIYDVSTQRVQSTLPMTASPLAFNRDLRLLAGYDSSAGRLLVTDLNQGAQYDLQRGLPDKLMFGPQSRMLYELDSYSAAGHDLARGQQVWRLDCRARGISLSGDGERLALLCNNDSGRWEIALLNARSGALLRRINVGAVNVLRPGLALDRTGALLALATAETVYVRDTGTGDLLWSDNCEQRTDESRVAFSADSTRITAISDGVPIVWDAASGERLARLTHAARATMSDFLPDGRISVHYREEQTVRLFAPGAGGALARFPLPASGDVRVRFSNDGARLAIVLDQLAFSIPMSDPARRDEYRAPTRIADWRMSTDGGILLLDVLQPEVPTGWWSTERLAGLTGVIWRPDQSDIVQIQGGAGRELRDPALSDNGARAAFTDGERTRVLDARTGETVTTLQHQTQVRGLSLSRDGAYLSASVADSEAEPSQFLIWQYQPSTDEVWDIASASVVNYDEATEFPPQHTEVTNHGLGVAESGGFFAVMDVGANVLMQTDIRYVAEGQVLFSPDGAKLAIASNDRFALYDISALRRTISEIEADLCADLILPQPPTDWDDFERRVGGICGLEIDD
ncbi:MAG: TIR domain-containing protein [Hyphomonadaceae bacterium]